MASVPKHVSLTLDGNRRWAKDQVILKLKGHQAGYDKLKEIAEHLLLNRGVEYVSAYIFSTENWNRTEDEVSYLMDLKA